MRNPVTTNIIPALALCVAMCAHGQGLQYAEKFSGRDAGEKIENCIAALPPHGGVCDARAFSGEQYSAGELVIGTPTKAAQLILGATTLTVSRTIRVYGKSSITGMPSGAGIGSYQGATVIKAANDSKLSAVVEIAGPLAVLQDVTIDGNKNKVRGDGAGVVVNRSGRIEMFRVTVQNNPGHGVAILSSDHGQESCCAKLQKLMSIQNRKSGLFLYATADVLISMSEFEENGQAGIELNGSPTMRLEHSDIGGNLEGIQIYGTPKMTCGNQMIIANQFGNNRRSDISISGWNGGYASTGNMIMSNQFLGGGFRDSGKYHAIEIVDSSHNLISSNAFFAAEKHAYRSCVSISGAKVKADQVSNNVCQASEVGREPGFQVPASTLMQGNH